MKLANMVDLGSAGSNTLQVQVLPIVHYIRIYNLYDYRIMQVARLELAIVYLEGRGINQLCYTCFISFLCN
jgi:hypothetical protein